MNLKLPILHDKPKVEVIQVEKVPGHFESKKLESDASGWATFFFYNCPALFVAKVREELNELYGGYK